VFVSEAPKSYTPYKVSRKCITKQDFGSPNTKLRICDFYLFTRKMFNMKHALYFTRNSSGDEIANVNYLYDHNRTRTTKYNRLVHKFRHKSTRCLCQRWNVCLPNSMK